MRSPGKQSRSPLTEYRAAFGRNLRAARERVGISQEALAHDIDMSRRYLSGIERGEANPTLDQVARLAEGLGVEPEPTDAVSQLMRPRRAVMPGRSRNLPLGHGLTDARSTTDCL